MESPSKGFEQSLQKLEQLVKNLETGNLPLEQALDSFQQGVGLVKECQELLSKSEQKVEMLIKANSETIETKKFDIP